MKESVPIQKEFGEVERIGNHLIIKRFGTDEQIGQVTFAERSEPAPHYVANWLWVAKEEQGKGFASQLMKEVETVSHERNIPVVLHDAIEEGGNPKSVGM